MGSVRPMLRLMVLGVLAFTALAAVAAFAFLRPSGTGATPANTMVVDAVPYQVDDDGDGLYDEDPGGLSHQGEGVDADGDNSIDEDNPGTAANDVDAARTVAGSGPFDVSVNITWGGTPEDRWSGYRATLAYDDSTLEFVAMLDMSEDDVPDSWAYTGLGLSVMDIAVVELDRDGDEETDALSGGSNRTDGTIDTSGQAFVVRFRCVGSGSSPLHLTTLAEDPTYGSGTQGGDFQFLPTALVDASVTCSPNPPTPTPTSTPPPAVGGVAELPDVSGRPGEVPGSAARGSRSSTAGYVAMAGAVVAATLAAGIGAWRLRARRPR